MIAKAIAKVREQGLLLFNFFDWLILLIKDIVSFILSAWFLVYIPAIIKHKLSNYSNQELRENKCSAN